MIRCIPNLQKGEEEGGEKEEKEKEAREGAVFE